MVAIETVIHKPVLLEEALELLRVIPGGVYVDGTLGAGGHARRILEALEGTGLLIGLDRDEEALQAARRELSNPPNLQTCHENFRNLPLLLKRLEFDQINGCLLDLGISSLQIDDPERGFSFRHDGPLDMRMDRQGQITAAQLVNNLADSRLAEIFREYGEEPQARKIAQAIVDQRKTQPFRRTGELAELVSRVKGIGHRRRRIHPATQVFQALRIEVNQELEGIGQLLDDVIDRLVVGGRLVVISFHSLEDRIVKRRFRLGAGRCICFRPPHVCRCPRRKRLEILTPRPLQASPLERQQNPRSSSAKLRAAEKLTVVDLPPKNEEFQA